MIARGFFRFVGLFKELAQLDVVRGQHEVHARVLGQVRNVAVRAGDGFVGVGARIQLVKNAEVPYRGALPPAPPLCGRLLLPFFRGGRFPGEFVQNLLAAPGLRLEQAVAPRRVRDVQVAVQLVVRVYARARFVEPVAQLLRKQDVQHRHLQDGGFAGRVRPRNHQPLVQRHRVFHGAGAIV